MSGVRIGAAEAVSATATVSDWSPRLWSVAPAPLAQSAERFHGKEKVVSSILTGGSLVDQSAGQGGVAQSVRALGS